MDRPTFKGICGHKFDLVSLKIYDKVHKIERRIIKGRESKYHQNTLHEILK